MKLLTLLLIFLTKLSFAFSSSHAFDISYYQTSNHKLTVKHVKKKIFKKLHTKSLSKGFNFDSFWIKITLKKSNADKILYINNPTIDFIDFYKNEKLIASSGDHRFNKNHKDIGFTFILEKNTSSSYYIRLQTQNGLFTRLTVTDPSQHLRFSDFEKMFLTFFFGFMLSLIIYNTFLFITLREKVYFYYIAFQLSIFMLLLSYSGLGYYLLWNGNYLLNEFIYQKFEILALFFALIFAQTFLTIKEHSIALNRAINIILILLLYILLSPWQYHSFLFQVVLIQTVLLGLVLILYAIYKRVEDANIFFVATVFILLGTLVTFLKIFGFLEVTFLTTWSIYIGSMIEAILFSLALANKINALKKREQALVNQQNKMLEDEVKKQTKFLNNTLKEKEILLKEVNHRVKNNLQVISSFVSFASINSKDKKTLQTLNQRIQAISLLYSSLYKPDSKTTVEMESYLEHLCAEIFKIYTPEVQLTLHIKEIKLDFDKAITIGLLINEILTNMIEHAFKQMKYAQIELSLKKSKQLYTLSIKDNGIGFDTTQRYEGLGLKLIKRLSEKQLRGQLLIESTHVGSTFSITFNNV